MEESQSTSARRGHSPPKRLGDARIPSADLAQCSALDHAYGSVVRTHRRAGFRPTIRYRIGSRTHRRQRAAMTVFVARSSRIPTCCPVVPRMNENFAGLRQGERRRSQTPGWRPEHQNDAKSREGLADQDYSERGRDEPRRLNQVSRVEEHTHGDEEQDGEGVPHRQCFGRRPPTEPGVSSRRLAQRESAARATLETPNNPSPSTRRCRGPRRGQSAQ